MTGLMLKDLYNLKKLGSTYLILFVVYSFIALSNKNASMMGGFLAVYCGLLPMTAMSFDERAKWDKYALTLPIQRKDMVLSKYLLGLLFSAFGFLVSCVMGLITSATFSETIEMGLIFFGISLFFMSLILPVMFRLGTEKGRVALMVILLTPTALILLAGKLFNDRVWISENFLRSLRLPAAIFIALLFLASIKYAISIYEKKDL